VIFLVYAVIGACVPVVFIGAVSTDLRNRWDSMRAHARTRIEQRLRWTPRWHRIGPDDWMCSVRETDGRGSADGFTPEQAFRRTADDCDALYYAKRKVRP